MAPIPQFKSAECVCVVPVFFRAKVCGSGCYRSSGHSSLDGDVNKNTAIERTPACCLVKVKTVEINPRVAYQDMDCVIRVYVAPTRLPNSTRTLQLLPHV